MDFSEKPVFWKALKPPLKDKCGELLVSLSYHPTNSTLTLIILKARNLKAKDINGKSGQDRKRKDVPQKKTKKTTKQTRRLGHITFFFLKHSLWLQVDCYSLKVRYDLLVEPNGVRTIGQIRT